MKFARYLPFVLLSLLLLVIGTAVAETNEPEAVESLSNWENPSRLTNANPNNSPNGAQRPVIAVAPNDTIIVAYLKQQSALEPLDADPFYRKSTDGGTTWTFPARIFTSADFSRQVDVAFDTNSKAHAVWTEDDNQLWYANEDDWAGNGATQLFTTADILIESPKIAVNSNGVLFLVWSQVDFSGHDIYFSRSFNGGQTWTSPPVNISNSGPASQSPAIAIDNKDRANVIWEEQVGGDVFQINYSRLSSGIWSTPTAVSSVVSGITSAREPTLAIRGSRVMVAFEDRISQQQQTLYFLECLVNCTANPPTGNQWRWRLATSQAFGAKDSDPTFLAPQVASVSQCRTIFFSGIAGNTSTNNEKIRLADSCNGFIFNPAIKSIEDSLGVNDRAIKPTVTVLNNWLVYLAYELKGPTRSDIYFVKNQPAVYLPAVIK